MQTLAALHPHLRSGDLFASDAVTVLSHLGGYDLVVSTAVAAWAGVSLESTYVGSDRVGYRGTHLVRARDGHTASSLPRISSR